MKDGNTYTLKSLNHFFVLIKNYSFKIKHIDSGLYCPITERILFIVMNESAKSETDAVRISTSHLGKLTGQKRSTISRRLKFMAKYSLITCFNEWSVDNKGIKNTQQIRVNPKINYILKNGAKQGIVMKCIESFFSKSIERDESETDLQGFQFNVKFGDKEPASIKDIQVEASRSNYSEFKQSESEAGDDISKMIAKEDSQRGQRMKDNKFWREKADKFVDIAGRLWRRAQMTHGYGEAFPNWHGATRDMSASAKRERAELVATLKQYGGKTSALTWYIYCLGKAEIDPKTLKPIFSPHAPHRQYITVDRKPSQYTKYFNAIIADPYFKEYATKKWEEVRPQLETNFGCILDLIPRDSRDEFGKTGIQIGQDIPSIDKDIV